MSPRSVSLLLSAIILSAVGAAGQAPVIDTFTPTSGHIGTSVTLSGANFSPTPSDNIVYFGAVRAAVTAATTGSLHRQRAGWRDLSTDHGDNGWTHWRFETAVHRDL